MNFNPLHEMVMSLTSTPSVISKKKAKPVQGGSTVGLIDMQRVAAIILGGGEGARLFPLTLYRCKPAICFGGKHRLIDIPVSNSLNSGCFKIFIITQFLASSLHQHILKTYRLDPFTSGFIELLAAEQKPSKKSWYEGTADAVRKNLEYFIETPVDYFLVLSGDQLYHMNYQNMVKVAKETDADLVVAATPIDDHRAQRMGILKVDERNRVTDFYEKPQDIATLERFAVPRKIMELEGLNVTSKRNYLGSMGIYLFKREVLLKMLEEDDREDFGKHLIPSKVKNGGVVAYVHNEYWEDIGTIESFYQANIGLTKRSPEFNIHDERHTIFSTPCNISGAKISANRIENTIVCDGSIVEAKEIKNSILGHFTVVNSGTVIEDSYIMGNDFYIPPIKTRRLPEKCMIGENCVLQRCIVDKNVYIGNGVQLVNKRNLDHFDSEKVFIRNGIIIVPRGATIEDGFVL